MKCLRALFLNFVLVFVAHAQEAAPLTDSIPVVLAEVLFSSPGLELEVYDGLMNGFPEFALPDDMQVLGSYLAPNSSRQVAVEAFGDPDAMESALTASVVNEGWQPIANRRQSNQGGFFSSTVSFEQPSSFCHDQLGQLTISEYQLDNRLFYKLFHMASRPGGGMSCDEWNQMQENPRMIRRGLAEHLPRLEMPEDTSGDEARLLDVFGGGTSSSSDSAETSSKISGNWAVEELLAHFTSQLEEQGWQLDEQNAGSLLAGSVWNKTVNDMELMGILTVISLEDDWFELQFRLLRKNGNPGRRPVIF